jgi:8-oxo-dGTP diphosphatase
VSPGTPQVLVVGAVAERDGRLLLGRRSASAGHGGLWELPGGKAEPGETPAEALSRELREELAVEADIGPVLSDHAATVSGRPLRFVAMRATLRGEPLALHAHDLLGWFAPAELDGLAVAPLDGPALSAWAGRTETPGTDPLSRASGLAEKGT